MSPFVRKCAGGNEPTASRLIDYLKSFPDYSNGMSKAALKIPFPFSFRLDIGVNSDLNLNSARDQIIYDEKWLTFEENLYRIICRRLKDTLSSSDWKILNEIIQKNNTDTFSRVANSFE